MRYKKYSNFDEIRSHQEVKIHSNNDWNNMYGVVENINKIDKRAEIFSMEFPDTRYIIREDNLNDIEMIVEEIHR